MKIEIVSVINVMIELSTLFNEYTDHILKLLKIKGFVFDWLTQSTKKNLDRYTFKAFADYELPVAHIIGFGFEMLELRKHAFGIPLMIGAIKSFGCNWWNNMHQINA